MVIGDSFNKELTLSFQILDYLLLQTPGAPVKQALLDAESAKTSLEVLKMKLGNLFLLL